MQVHQRAHEARPSEYRDDELMTMKAVLTFFGGDKPFHPSTLYRGISAGRYPAPIKPSPNIARWLRSECEAALRRIIEQRNRRG